MNGDIVEMKRWRNGLKEERREGRSVGSPSTSCFGNRNKGRFIGSEKRSVGCSMLAHTVHVLHKDRRSQQDN